MDVTDRKKKNTDIRSSTERCKCAKGQVQTKIPAMPEKLPFYKNLIYKLFVIFWVGGAGETILKQKYDMKTLDGWATQICISFLTLYMLPPQQKPTAC